MNFYLVMSICSEHIFSINNCCILPVYNISTKLKTKMLKLHPLNEIPIIFHTSNKNIALMLLKVVFLATLYNMNENYIYGLPMLKRFLVTTSPLGMRKKHAV